MIAALALAALPAALVDALLPESDVRRCVQTQSDFGDTVLPAAKYLEKSLDAKYVRLDSGEQMVMLVGNDGCFAVGQSAKVYVYERTARGYRKVLDDVVIPTFVQIGTNGTVTLPTHDTMETIMESVYVWNGNTYAFSPFRSTLYDLEFATRAPYQTPVRFAPGTSNSVLKGAYAENFGREFVFVARKGQRVRLDLLHYGGEIPRMSVWIGETEVGGSADGHPWNGVLPRDGTYDLLIDGPETARDLHDFTIQLSVR